MPESIDRGALTEAVYYILLALHVPTHGYGIMKFIKRISKGRVILGSGTLYGAINTLLIKGWIKIATEQNPRNKKEYILTDTGKQILLNEIKRLEELLSHGEKIVGGNDHDA